MEARLVICAESVAIDQRRNSLSLFHVIEEFNAPTFPLVVPHMSVVILLSREGNEPQEPTDVNLRLYLEDQQFWRNALAINFQGHLKLRFLAEMQALVIQRPGSMRVTVNQDDRELGSWKISVNA